MARLQVVCDAVLNGIDGTLKDRTFLAAQHVTLADVAMACTLHPVFAQVCLPSVGRHFGLPVVRCCSCLAHTERAVCALRFWTRRRVTLCPT